jgi:DNA mismatch repair protein MutS
MSFPYNISLLWPPNHVRKSTFSSLLLGENSIRDLDLARTISALNADRHHRQNIEKILLYLCDDPQVILYRQDILEDLLTQPDLAVHFENLFPILDELSYSHYREDREKPLLHEVIWRMNELARFVECVEELNNIFQDIGKEVRSEGLRFLRDEIVKIEHDETFQHLVQELPELLSHLNAIKSVTIGVNLDHNFHPVEATLLSVNKETVTATSLLRKLFGKSTDGKQGIAPLHSAPKNVGPTGLPVRPIMDPLFQDLAKVLEKVCQPIAKALKRYVNINSGVLANLGQELRFYSGAVKLIRRVTESGLPMCKPELVSKEERVCEIEENYNLNLALHLMTEEKNSDLSDVVVKNEVIIGPQASIIILTGPNLGGKTTYIQAVGLTHILAQAGLYIPGTKARISPVDNIYTHFPTEEQFEEGTGRLGDEVKRLHEMFAQATRHSLILLNESLSSTNSVESLYLAEDIVRILRLMGVRTIFATHLHELAARVDTLNSETSGDNRIISMVASLFPEEDTADTSSDLAHNRSYKVIPSPPMRSSYAKEIARQYGVSFEQLRSMLHERGVLDTESADD